MEFGKQSHYREVYRCAALIIDQYIVIFCDCSVHLQQCESILLKGAFHHCSYYVAKRSCQNVDDGIPMYAISHNPPGRPMAAAHLDDLNFLCRSAHLPHIIFNIFYKRCQRNSFHADKEQLLDTARTFGRSKNIQGESLDPRIFTTPLFWIQAMVVYLICQWCQWGFYFHRNCRLQPIKVIFLFLAMSIREPLLHSKHQTCWNNILSFNASHL